MRISDARLDYFMGEDVPYFDLTTEALGIGREHGTIEYFTREDCTLCGTEEAQRIFERMGGSVVEAKPSGTSVAAGGTFLRVEAPADVLHLGWKVCLNIFDHCSAVATKTRAIVDAAHAGNPSCGVFATRKSMPGSKDLLVKAVVAGGGLPHRLGLSETILVFEHHMTFLGGFDAFVEKLPALRAACAEKKVFVEATADQALALARAGVDGIQLDKVAPGDVGALVRDVRAIDPSITLIAAGGVNERNAQAYAEAGVDGLATTAPFNAKALDMSVRMTAS